MFRTTHIRTKLAAALAVPLIALVAVAGYEVISATRAAEEVELQTELATASLGPGSFVSSLQDERNRAAIDLIGLGDAAELPVQTNDEARELSDAALVELRSRVEGASDDVKAAFAEPLEAVEGLVKLRADVDAYDGPMDISNEEFADEIFTRYTDLIESFFDATSTVALSVDDADLRNGVELIDAATRQGEMRARIVRSAVLAVVTDTARDPGVIADIAALYDRGLGYDLDIRTNAVGPFAGIAEPTFAEPDVQDFNSQVEAYLAGEPLNIATMLAAVSSDPDSGYLGLRNRAGAALQDTAQSLRDDAAARQRLFILIAGGTLALAIVVTWLASRSITRPLRSLKVQAEHMAGESLPAAVRQILETPAGEDVVIPEIEPITVKSHDEVADVAGALSAVQSSALDLAVEQAVLRRNISDSYVNLGRRNQNLLSRQLDFITELERNESDPDTLEGLFKLDHLATRMRRNAESLLVLAGIEPPRQWSAPVKVADVVRAALGEVEDYQRVVVRHLEPAAITGAVASDVAHVAAELLENALSFSPPDQTVEVKGRLTVEGYTLAITDNGLGMSAEDLARANRRLAGEESFTVAPSRYLGHYVAGHLAKRMGVKVELQDSPAGGVVARIDLPMALLADEETDPFVAARAGDAQPSAEPVEAADTAAEAPAEDPAPAAPASFTESGLPRRGERRSEPAEVEASPTAASSDNAGTERSVPQPTLSWGAAPADGDAWAAPSVTSWADRPLSDEQPAPDGPRIAAPRAGDDANGGDTPAPESRPEPSRGFGGLAVTQPSGPSMFSVAAEQARQRGDAPADAGTTPTGLVKRVPGAQRPDAPLGGARPEPEAPAEEERSTPEDVYAFLSSFQSGVSRGRADAHRDHPEDER